MQQNRLTQAIIGTTERGKDAMIRWKEQQFNIQVKRKV